MPRWVIARALANPPAWLSNHVDQPTAIGLFRSGKVHWPDDDSETGLFYRENEGIVIDSGRVPKPRGEEFDESYD